MIRFSLFLLITCLTLSGFSQEKTEKYLKPRKIKKAMKQASYWQLDHPKHKNYEWHNGAFYQGVFAAYETLGSKKIYKALLEMGEGENWQPGKRWFHADDHVIAQTYIDLYRIEKDQQMIQPIIDTIEVFMNNEYPKRWIENYKWWWCDALFMGPPTLVKLGITLNDDKYLKYTDQLFKESYDSLYDQQVHLYARDSRYKINNDENDIREANGQKVFWSRGNGWVMGGLVMVIEELPKDYPTRNFYIQNFKEMAAKIKSIKPEDGLWRASLLDPDAYPGGESSGSGFYCYALAWGINNGILDKNEYLPTVEKAWVGLCKNQHKNGMVGWVQPVGADPKKNFSADSWEVYGTGAFLLAGSEVIKLDRK